MRRPIVTWVLLLMALASMPDPARAESATEKAEALNETGKKLYKAEDYRGAATKFREAIAISPEARFFFNLCATLEKAEDFDAALEACDQVYDHNPSDALKAKTGERAADIRTKKKRQDDAEGASDPRTEPPIPTPPLESPTPSSPEESPTPSSVPAPSTTGATSPASPVSSPPDGEDKPTSAHGPPETVTAMPPGSAGSSPVVRQDSKSSGHRRRGGRKEQATLTANSAPEYRWSLGAELGAAWNRNLGTDFTENGAALKLNADFLLLPQERLGVRGYFNVTAFGEQEGEGLRIVDLGGAIFWHARLLNNLFLTPVGGVHIAFLQPQAVATEEAFPTFGLRLEVGLHWVGGNGKHVFSFVPACFNAYLPAAGELSTGELPEWYGLDKGGGTWAVTLGYTRRFTNLLPGLIVLE